MEIIFLNHLRAPPMEEWVPLERGGVRVGYIYMC